MVPTSTTRRSTQAGSLSSGARSGFDRWQLHSAIQPVIAAGFGIVLGGYALGALILPRPWTLLLLLAALGLASAMVVGTLKRTLLAIVLLDTALNLDVNPGYQDEIAQLGALSGWNISMTTLALAGLYALWLVEGLTTHQPRQGHLLRGPARPLALFLALGALSAVAAGDPSLSSFELFLLGQMFLLYVYLANNLRTRSDVVFVVTLLAGSLMLESLIIIGIYLTGHDVTVAGFSSRVDESYTGGAFQPSRVGGTLGSPNVAASYLSLLAAPALSLALTKLDRRYQALGILAFGMAGLALIPTLSRGGWIAFAVAVTALCLVAWQQGRLSPNVPIMIFAVLALSALVFHAPLTHRLFGDDGGAAQARIPLMVLALRIVADNPVFGVGLNNYATAISDYATPEFGQEWLYVVHNAYLRVWAETGIGILAYLGFLGLTVKRGWEASRFGGRVLAPIALGLTAGVLGQMVHMHFDVFNSRPQVQALWVVAALMVAIHTIVQRGEDVDAPNTCTFGRRRLKRTGNRLDTDH